MSILKNLSNKYESNKSEYNIKQINDIVFNERMMIVSRFKDYLIIDDNSEFFKRYLSFLYRFYHNGETAERLSRIYEFYEINSKIFPNYIILSESRYIYKNIQKKQKLIDELQEMEMFEKEKEICSLESPYKDRVINTEECNSIMNQTQSVCNLNLKSTKKNSNNNSFNSIEMLVNNIIRADTKKRKNESSTIFKERKNSSGFINKPLSSKKIIDGKKNYKKIPSFDFKVETEIMKKKENLRKKFITLKEKMYCKNPEKSRIVESIHNDPILIKTTIKSANINTKNTNYNTIVSKSQNKSRNQPYRIESSKTNHKTFEREIQRLTDIEKTPEILKTVTKKNSQISITNLLLGNSNGLNKFISKNSNKIETKIKPVNSKKLSEIKETVPFTIMINLDNTIKNTNKKDQLPNNKFTRNIRSKLLIEQTNTSYMRNNNLQLSNTNNNFKSANKLIQDKSSAKQTIESSYLISNNKETSENIKSRNQINQQFTKQDSIKNHQITNIFLSNNKLQNTIQNRFNQTKCMTKEIKNHTPDFVKAKKFDLNSKSPLKMEEGQLLKKKMSQNNNSSNNKLYSEMSYKNKQVLESTIPSQPNTSRIDIILDKKHNKISI